MLPKEENELITRTGPGTPMGELWRRFWLPAFMSWELPAPDCPPVRIRLLSEDLVGFRDSRGRAGLLAANCPHRGASLFFGRNEEEGLRCVYHGWKFDVAGNCVDMPNEPAVGAQHAAPLQHKIHHTAYPCVEKAGIVWTYMGPKHLEPDFPQLAWTLLPEAHRYVLKFQVECNYLQAMEGDIDNSHVPFAHGRIDPDRSLPFLERLRSSGVRIPGQPPTTFYAEDLSPRGILKETDYGLLMGWRRETGPDAYNWHINHWFIPHSTVMGAAPPGSLLSNMRVPIDDENSWQFRIRWNPYRPLDPEELRSYKEDGLFFPALIPGSFRCVENLDNDYLIDREQQRTVSVTGIKSQTQQDRAVNETMGRIYDRTKEHLGTSDAVIIAMRRRLLKAARLLTEGNEPYAASHGEVYRQIPVDIDLPRDRNFEEGARDYITGANLPALAT